MSVPVALPAALAYGIADFTGGLAARRAPVLVVTAVAQGVGLLVLLPVLGLVPGRPSVSALVFGAVAGVAGGAGLLLYLRALAVGPMGVVAPLSAVVGAGLPLVVGVLGGERPGPVTLIAIGIALVAVVMATAGPRRGGVTGRGPLLGLGAGVGFGLFFIGLDATPADSGLWPLVSGRLLTVVLLGALLVGRRSAGAGPARPVIGPLMIVSGVFDSLRQRALPAGHAPRRPRSELGRGVALPGGRRAAGPRRAPGAVDRAAARQRRTRPRRERAAGGEQLIRRARTAATAALPTPPG